MNKLFTSSVNPEKLAATWSGAIILLGGMLLPEFNWENAVGSIVGQIMEIVKVVGVVGGSIRMGYGLVRKLWMELKDIWMDIKSLKK